MVDKGKVWFVGIRIVDRTPVKEFTKRVSDILTKNGFDTIGSGNLIRSSRVMINIIASNVPNEVIRRKELDKLFDSNHFDEAMNYILEKEKRYGIKRIEEI